MKTVRFAEIKAKQEFYMFGYKYVRVSSIEDTCIGPYGFRTICNPNDNVQVEVKNDRLMHYV